MSQSLAPPIQAVPCIQPKSQVCPEERALAGDSAGWSELVGKHNHRVVLTLLSRGIRPDTARDLAQEAWTRLIEQQRLGRLSKIRMPGLVIKQALFLARDYARRDRDVEHETAELEHEVKSPLPRLWARERLEKARQSLNLCTPTERRVFCAMYEGPSTNAQDVARLTGLSVQRVRQITCEVRKKLRDAMKGTSDE